MSIEWNITSKRKVLKGCISDEELTELILPEGVKAIGDDAFQYHENLKSVIIPEGVTTIGFGAFFKCKNLEHIQIPESVENIGMSAFEGTAWMKQHPDDFVIVNQILLKYQGEDLPETLFIPEGVRVINAHAFDYAEWYMKRIIFPESVEIIGEKAFHSCTALKEILLPDSLTQIGFEAFEGCHNLKRVPIFTVNGKIFYKFSGKNSGQLYAEYFVRNRAYEEMEIISPELRYDLIFQIYGYAMDEEGTGRYIQKHFPEMISVLIQLNDDNLFRKLNEQFPDLIEYHIDTMILEANQQENYTLQLLLTNYKYQHYDFREKDWNL